MDVKAGIPWRFFIAPLLAALCCGCPRSDESDGEEPAWPEASIRVEETDLNTVFGAGWVHANTSYDWSGGTATFTREPGASMSFSFTGTRIRWLGWRDSTAGVARVRVDGEFAGMVDLYARGLEVQAPVFTSDILEPGAHTLTIEATGEANPESAGVKVVVDAFEIVDGVPPPVVTRIEETDPSLSLTGDWQGGNVDCPVCSGGGYLYTRGPDALASFSFTGTRVRWLGWRKDLAGIARVYLDGALAAEVDLYSATASAQAPLFTSEVLADGPHTLLIEAPGMGGSAAGDTIISVDAFDIVGEVPLTAAYTIVDLGTLGGAASSAKDINNRGEIVGWANIADGKRRAFLYRHGAMIDLGTLIGGGDSEAAAINDHGHVTGSGGRNPYGFPFREFTNGFVWQAGTMENLEGVFCPCSFNQRFGISVAYGINNSGQAVGRSETIRGTGVIHSTLWNYHGPGSGMINRGDDIGAGAGDWEVSRAFDINDSGKAVGDYAPEAGRLGILERRAFLWKDGTRSDLGALPGHISSTALAVNGEGAAAGWSGSPDAHVARAVLWRHGSIQDLGVLPGAANSQALDINGGTWVVGWSGAAIGIAVAYDAPGSSEITDPASARAFLWRHGRMLDLNELMILDETGAPASGWVLTEAAAINDSGQIAGTGFHNGEMRAFLLDPVSH